MIFFGTRGKVIAGEAVQGVQCPNCESSQFNSFGILRYFHLYWIPTFPTSKKVGLECTNCKHALVDDDVPAQMAADIRTNVFTFGKLLPRFTGLILLAFAGLGLYDAMQRDDARESAYLEAPAVNDLYIVDFTEVFIEADPEYPYGLLRITDINADEIEMQMGGMLYNRGAGVRQDISDGKAAQDEYYEAEFISFEADELRAYWDSGAFYSVDRP